MMSRVRDAPLTALRRVMADQAVAACIVPSEDAHQSEYVAPAAERRRFLSGFTGSAGTAVVTATQALLWTDGRYFDQATNELSSSWTLMRQGNADVPQIHEWLASNLKRDARIAVDPFVTSLSVFRTLTGAGLAEITPITPNLVDTVWDDKPDAPADPVFTHPREYSGESTQDKLAAVRQRLEEKGAFAFVVCALDEVAWLLNLRGSDIAFNPVFFSYAIVTMEDVLLFIDSNKLSTDVADYLSGLSVQVLPYDAIVTELSRLPVPEGKKIWIDPLQCSLALFNAIRKTPILELQSPVCELKAIKNDVELEGFRQCHIRDGAAVCQFLCWLEAQVKAGAPIDEISAADKLEAFRKRRRLFKGLSFSTIPGSGPNGAIIHYHPTAQTKRPVTSNEMFLLDSGGQYLDGTTDVTRTVHFGEPTQHEVDCFTRVLIGHIRLAMATFPGGTTGHQLDCLARTSLWSVGLNFNHGTGHGVGSFLNVHEGPHGISHLLRRIAVATSPLKAGMTVTNEPGYYETGRFGIRTESVMLVRPQKTQHEFGSAGWLGFETVTMVPLQASLMNLDLMSDAEIEWVDNYHAECLEKLAPELGDDRDTLAWLHKACRPLRLAKPLHQQ
ncbi:unnamed protein product (mitochondrion) [Plasmodiophora brassicae]|uniref:Peptidase M24 domain-containing protein n=1 Tax=Plasmodiophora brassicae TaxID=37360 RepID=A0A0G4J1Y0_PLABS|nr:hypothetical protein PBRA_001959 [Plasmodiophora brassicae]SPR01380.1 unnamed protein product [Plasmodiophora brassicae]